METTWTQHSRKGWYQDGPCHFEYLAENPTHRLWAHRRPMGTVYQNMKMKWVAETFTYSGEACMHFKKLGEFQEDKLLEAMVAIENNLSQIQLFQES